jgi:hypothetical protein
MWQNYSNVLFTTKEMAVRKISDDVNSKTVYALPD